MLIRNPKAFTRGMLLMTSFIAVFVLFFMPIFPSQEGGERTNGLVYADHMFNTLAKGSANFFDSTLTNRRSVNVAIQAVKDTEVDITITFKNADLVADAVTLLNSLGLEAQATESRIAIKGNLFTLLDTIVSDAELLYHNNVDAITEQRGIEGRRTMRIWWNITSTLINPMQQRGMNSEASIVNTVMTKGIEPAYNFFGITPQRVVDNIPLVAGFLIFYVIYTMWYGFAIFELFEGIGLTMTKSVKQEV